MGEVPLALPLMQLAEMQLAKMQLAKMQLMETNLEAKVVTLVKVVHLVVDQVAKKEAVGLAKKMRVKEAKETADSREKVAVVMIVQQQMHLLLV